MVSTPAFNLMLLPPELRQTIWDMSYTDDSFFVVGGVCMATEGLPDIPRVDTRSWCDICACLPGVHYTTEARLPAAATACFEALYVAQRRARESSTSRISWRFRHGSEYLALPKEFFENHNSLSVFGRGINTVTRFFTLADEVGACPVIPWSPIHAKWEDSWHQCVRGEIGVLQKFISVCENRRMAFFHEVVSIHASRPQAVASGIWGPSAEDTTKVVDLYDSHQIRRFFGFWDMVTPAGEQKAYAARAIWKSFADDKRLGLSKRWLEEWQTKYLHAKWQLALRDDETLAGVFPNGVNYPFILNKEHPWVAAAKASLPKIELKIVFQLCTNQKCALPSQTMQWRN